MASGPSPARVFFQVKVSVVDDVRQSVFAALEAVQTNRRNGALANEITRRLRAAGLLASALEQLYSAGDFARLMGNRSVAWVVKHAKAGDFGPVYCDGGDWLIPASGALKYLAGHEVEVSA